MNQQTRDWHEWRLNGIGSSDAAVIMNVSPWKTPFQLWEEKSRKKPADNKEKFVMRKGHEYEPYARAKYELINDLDMKAVLAEHKDYPFLRASTDGFNFEKMKGIEIKYTGEDDHNLAKQKKVPEKYKPQIQHQIFVTGAKSIDYLSYHVPSGKGIKPKPSQGDLVVVEVKPDLQYIENMLAKEIEFWNMVQNDIAPDLTDKDFRVIIDPQHERLSREYIDTYRDLKVKENKLEMLREELIQVLGDMPRAVFDGSMLEVTRLYRRGNVDYKKVPELKNVDLDNYRGKSTSYVTVKVPK